MLFHPSQRQRAVGPRSLIVGPDGRILRQAGEKDTIMTEMLDLDRLRDPIYEGIGKLRNFADFH